MSGVRHLTATGFVVSEDRVLLHWHRKNRLWLPFGGHIEPNEDPVQAVLREIEEESGLRAEVIGPANDFGIENLPVLPPPVTILVEPTTDGVTVHQHIDLIYFCRAAGPLDSLAVETDPTIRWVTEQELEQNEPVAPLPDEPAVPVSDDVRLLALAAIKRGRESGSQSKNQ